MIGKILLAVDGSQHALRAIDLAAELAVKLDAKLFIVHVLMHGRPSVELVNMVEVEHLVKESLGIASPGVRYVPGTYLDILNNRIEEARTASVISAIGDQIVANAKAHCLELGVRTVETSVLSGDYAEKILLAAQKHSADMIVIGSRGLGSIQSTVLGSVSQKVLHHAKCAVVTAR